MANLLGRHLVTTNPIEFREEALSLPRRPYPNILIEGDSWFDYPGHTGDFLRNPTNIMEAFLLQDHYGANWFDTAVSGATTSQMANDLNLLRVFKDRRIRFRAILVSGGGNDLFANADALLEPYNGQTAAAQCLAPKPLERRLQKISDYYARLQRYRDRFQPQATIIGHGYAPPTARNRAYQLFGFIKGGPWINPALDRQGYKQAPDALRHDVIRLLHQHLSNTLRDTLTHSGCVFFDIAESHLDLDQEEYWADEIHLSPKGYTAYTEAFLGFLIQEGIYPFKRL